MVGLNVRYNGAEAGTTGMTVPVTEGDTAERLTDGDNFVLILQLSDGTTKEIRLGEDGSRLHAHGGGGGEHRLHLQGHLQGFFRDADLRRTARGADD